MEIEKGARAVGEMDNLALGNSNFASVAVHIALGVEITV